MTPELTPGDLKHRFMKREGNIKPNLLDAGDLKAVPKPESIENEERFNVVMGRAFTNKGDVILGKGLPSAPIKPEHTEHNPSPIITELYPNHPAFKSIPSDPRISSDSHVKLELIEVDSKQHLINREETICELENLANNNLISIEEEKLKSNQETIIITNFVNLPIDVDSAYDGNDDIPSVLEDPPAPRYDMANHINTLATTMSSELSETVEPVHNINVPAADIPRNSEGVPPAKRRRVLFDTVMLKKYSSFRIVDRPPVTTMTAELPNPIEPFSINDIAVADISRNSEGVPPAKRRRVLFDAVVLQKLSSPNTVRRPPVTNIEAGPVDVTKVFIKPKPVSEGDKAKLKILRSNPDIKVKKKTVLSDEGVVCRLRALGPGGLDPYPIDLGDNIKMATVTRIWMSDTYGCNRRLGCSSIDKKRFTHGIDNFRYITYESCPDAPRAPGAPGLMLGCRGGEDQAYTNQRVFVRVNDGQWLAMGLYDCIPSNPLSREEWNAQSSAFQNFWVTEFSSKKWAAPARVRIGLRNTLGREPSVEEYESALRKGSYKRLSTVIIKEAFASGHENLFVWCMKCVGYDTDFQRTIATMPKDYVSSEGKRRGTGGKEKLDKATAKPRAVVAKPGKRKRHRAA